LSFSKADANIILADNISKYKEIKLRLLNGTHTFSCALALFCGYNTVKEAMQNDTFREFVKELVYKELIPATLNEDITEEEAKTFAANVMDRFSNPFIAHEWINICAQYTLKMNARTIPLLLNYYKLNNRVPRHMALGFAAYLLFMRSTKNTEKDNCFEGRTQSREYTIHDEKAAVLYQHWNKTSITASVHSILSDASLWGSNLAILPNFEKNVIGAIEVLNNKGGIEAILQKELITL
jgi:tagaturonate reductase